MRHFLSCLLCSACLFAASCNSQAPSGPKPPAGAWTNDPQKIVSEPGNIRVLHGEFEIRDAKPNETYMASATLGGACVLAHIPVEGKSCTAASQCNINEAGVSWTGYCLGADHLPTTQGGSCWVKLSDKDNCLKGVGKGQHSTPAMDVTPAYTYTAVHSPHWHQPIDWLLLGCLNGTPPGGCAGGSGPKVATASQVRPVP